MPPGLKLKEADMDMVEALHKKGILYLEVPIRPDDHVAIPPLEVWLPCMLRTVHRGLRHELRAQRHSAAVLIRGWSSETIVVESMHCLLQSQGREHLPQRATHAGHSR